MNAHQRRLQRRKRWPGAIPKLQVTALLRRIARGEIPITVRGTETWDERFAGNVAFHVEGFIITFFNDCDSLDYVDQVESPDGSVTDFDSLWWQHPKRCCPSDLLSVDDVHALELALKAAKVSP